MKVSTFIPVIRFTVKLMTATVSKPINIPFGNFGILLYDKSKIFKFCKSPKALSSTDHILLTCRYNILRLSIDFKQEFFTIVNF